MEPTAEHTPDAQYEATPAGAAHEHTDANVWLIVKFLVWLGVAAAVIHVGLALLFNLFVAEREERTPPRYPLATAESSRLPPEPRLQRFPREDIQNLRRDEDATLNSYGWVDKSAGTVRIPIEEAMKLTLQRGLPSRRTLVPPGRSDVQPSDASAGRR
jgi:hypothetical protein